MTTTDLSDRLLTGERILWSGRPAQGLLFTGRDTVLIPFMFGAFAVFWESMVLTQQNAPGFFMLWGVPFVLIGLYLIVGRFLLDAWIRAGTDYAVTNKRILIPAPGRSANSRPSVSTGCRMRASAKVPGGAAPFGSARRCNFSAAATAWHPGPRRSIPRRNSSPSRMRRVCSIKSSWRREAAVEAVPRRGTVPT
jgi:hypothetical protein